MSDMDYLRVRNRELEQRVAELATQTLKLEERSKAEIRLRVAAQAVAADAELTQKPSKNFTVSYAKIKALVAALEDLG